MDRKRTPRICGLVRFTGSQANSFKRAVAYKYITEVKKVIEKEATTLSRYKWFLRHCERDLDFSSISSNIVTLIDIELFELRNKNWSFNVYTIVDNNVRVVVVRQTIKYFHLDLYMSTVKNQIIYKVIKNFD